MNSTYDPKNEAQIEDYVNYVSPVDGVKPILLKQEPEIANEPADLPEQVVHQELLDPAVAERRRRTELNRGLQRGAQRLSGDDGDRAVPYLLLGRGRSGWSSSSSFPSTSWGNCSLYVGRRSAASTSTGTGPTTPTRSRSTTPSSCAPSSTRGSPPLLALLIAYPLAYAIAFKAGRWRNAAALRGRRPVLHHVPDPDDRLEDDPHRREPSRRRPADARPRAADGHVLATPGGGDRRAHLQLPAVHDPAALREPRADRPAADRGRQGPLLVLTHRLPAR